MSHQAHAHPAIRKSRVLVAASASCAAACGCAWLVSGSTWLLGPLTAAMGFLTLTATVWNALRPRPVEGRDLDVGAGVGMAAGVGVGAGAATPGVERTEAVGAAKSPDGRSRSQTVEIRCVGEEIRFTSTVTMHDDHGSVVQPRAGIPPVAAESCEGVVES